VPISSPCRLRGIYFQSQFAKILFEARSLLWMVFSMFVNPGVSSQMNTLQQSSSTGRTWKHDAVSNQDHSPACQIMERTLRVLLVEDAPFLRYAFGRLLRLEGFEVKEVNDGREALDCLAAFRPDLVLTDLMMPVMGGVELISKIRADPDTAAIPIVAITADATEQAERNARKAGAVDFITKPIDLTALLDRLRVLVH
jgi:CheY-like chemotaxis protein